MDDFEVPNFSLGLDFESQRPSFSLGIDIDEPEIPPAENEPSYIIHIQDSQESSDREPQQPDSNPGPAARQTLDEEPLQCIDEEEPLPTLKRLKRGPPAKANADDFHTPAAKIHCSRFEADKTSLDCDDIEDFSTDDDFMTDYNKTPNPIGKRNSRSAKLLLHGKKVVTSSSSQILNSTPSIARSSNSSIGRSGQKLSRTDKIRLLSKIHHIAGNFSDEEENIMFGMRSAACDEGATSGASNAAAKSVLGSQKILEGAKPFERKVPSQDPRKCFNVLPNTSLPSPAFDEFCDEYFSSFKKTNNVVSGERHDSIVDNSVPPSYQYFDNEDPRIQMLLRQRLHHFLPISAVMRGEGQSAEQVDIDYLGQFGSSRDANGSSWVNLQGPVSNLNKKKSTSRRLAKRKRPTRHGNERSNRTTTRNRICDPAAPRDAGKRRVSAGGRWYTDKSGRKIYVSKNGQEMAGQVAYMHYTKDNEKIVRGSKKKLKKNATKKSKVV